MITNSWFANREREIMFGGAGFQLTQEAINRVIGDKIITTNVAQPTKEVKVQPVEIVWQGMGVLMQRAVQVVGTSIVAMAASN